MMRALPSVTSALTVRVKPLFEPALIVDVKPNASTDKSTKSEQGKQKVKSLS